MYCITCGDPAEEGRVTCRDHTSIFFALHDFVSAWEEYIPKEMKDAIRKSPYLYDPRTGKRYEEKED